MLDPDGIKIHFYIIRWSYAIERDAAQVEVERQFREKMEMRASRYASRSRERDDTANRMTTVSGDEFDDNDDKDGTQTSQVCSIF